MINKPPPPKLLRLLLNETKLAIPMFLLIVAVFFIVGMFFQVPPEQQGSDFWIFMVAMVGLVIASVAFMRRQIRSTYDQWDRGIIDVAQILTVEMSQYGRARVREMLYTYEYDGQTYKKRHPATRREYTQGSQLTIMIDPEKPDNPIVISDYINVQDTQK